MMKLESLAPRHLLASAALVAALGAHAASAQMLVGEKADTLYRNVKSLEPFFPAALPYDTLTVVVLDARTGSVTGPGTVPSRIFPWRAPPPRPKPVNAKIGDKTADVDPPDAAAFDPDTPREVRMNVIDAGLRFVVDNATAGFEVQANGIKASPATGQNSVIINVKDAKKVDWTIRYGQRTASGTFALDHSPWPIAGVFTIPALPVALLYEPPMDNARQNKTSLSGESQVGTAVTTSFSSVDHGAKQGMPTGFEDVESFKSNVRTVSDGLGTVVQAGSWVADKTGSAEGKAAAKTASEVADGLKKVSGALDKLLGSASATQQIDRTSLREHRLEVASGTASSGWTFAQLGPGLGDNIIYLKDVRFLYLGAGAAFHVLPIGYRREVGMTASALRADLDSIRSAARGNAVMLDTLLGPNSRLKRQNIEALLALDPFVAGGASATLDPKRYSAEGEFEPNGLCRSDTVWHSATASDMQGSVTTTSYVEDLQKGALAFLGLGVTQSVHIDNAITESSSTQRSKSTKQSATFTLCAGASEHYVVGVYFDRVFGTFAVRSVPAAEQVIAGRLVDASGSAKPNQRVVLTVNGRRYVTYSDASGRYAFHSSSIPLTQGTLDVAGRQQTVILQRRSAPVDVRLP